MEEAIQKSCGLSITGDTYNSTGKIPEKPDLASPAPRTSLAQIIKVKDGTKPVAQ